METLIEVRNHVLARFIDKTLVTLDDLSTITLSEELKSRSEAIFQTVLSDLVKADVVREVESDARGGVAWMLTVPLSAGMQEVPIDSELAIGIAHEINAYREGMEMQDEWPPADAMQINPANIYMLLAIITDLRSEDSEHD